MVELQPLWKICSSKWVHLPQIGLEIPKNRWVATTYRYVTRLTGLHFFLLPPTLHFRGLGIGVETRPAVHLDILSIRSSSEKWGNPKASKDQTWGGMTGRLGEESTWFRMFQWMGCLEVTKPQHILLTAGLAPKNSRFWKMTFLSRGTTFRFHGGFRGRNPFQKKVILRAKITSMNRQPMNVGRCLFIVYKENKYMCMHPWN